MSGDKLPKGWRYKCAQNRRQDTILELLAFWWPKASPRFDGHRWLVWSMEEWATHHPQTKPPSDKTIRRELKKLEANGIITTRLSKHPYRWGIAPALWVRPDPVGIRTFLTANMTGNVTANMTGNVTETIVQLTSLTSEQLEQQKVAAPSETHAHQEDDMAKASGADFLLKKKTGATIDGALSAFSSGPKTAATFPIIKTPQVAHDALVAACRAAGHPNPGAMTMKRAGQMKVMIKRMSDELEQPGQIAEVIFFVCAKWSQFQGWAKTLFNATVGGTVPNHDALTMFAVEAVGFWQGYKASNTVQEKKSAGGSNLEDDDFA